MTNDSWKQASLPVRHGGMGLRSVGSLALPCYISSLTKAHPLVEAILKENNLPKSILLHFFFTIKAWQGQNSGPPFPHSGTALLVCASELGDKIDTCVSESAEGLEIYCC